MPHINYLAAIAAGVVGFFPGALWYSPLMFLRRWAQELGIDIEKAPEAGSHIPKILFGLAASIVMAITFALIAGPAPTLHPTLHLALACAGLITGAYAIQYQFEDRSLAFWAINTSYHLVQFLLFALVLGLWPWP